MKEVKVTFFFPEEERRYMKLLCAKLGITMKSFITTTLMEKIEQMEDQFLGEAAMGTLRRIESGEEETTLFYPKEII